MKKFYFLAVMAMLAMSTTSCQQDDDFSASAAKAQTKSEVASTSYQFTVSVSGIAGVASQLSELRSEAAKTMCTYFKELLGTDATVSGTNGNYFTVSGKGNKDVVLKKIKNVDQAKINEVMSKAGSVYMADFTVSDGWNTVVELNYDNFAK